MFSALPESKRQAVDRALAAVAGTSRLKAVAPLSGGFSGAGVYGVKTSRRSFVLRVDGDQDPLRSRAGWYDCMVAAGEAGVGPRVLHADRANGVTVVQRLPSRPLSEAFGGSRAGLIAAAAELVARLHRLPIGPPVTEYLDGMAVLVARFQVSGLLSPSATAEVFDRFARLADAYRSDPADLVLAHNDLNPGNLIFDGARLWLIDWEAAFRADRFLDLAGLANAFARTPDDETLLLRAYFGAEPTADRRARLVLMRQVNNLFYALVMLNAAADERIDARAADAVEPPPFLTLRARLDDGHFRPDTWLARVTYGKSRLQLTLAGMRSAAFEQALTVLR